MANIQKRQEDPPPKNREERMDVTETDEEEENVHPWTTVSSTKKRENKHSKPEDNQP